MGKSSSGRPRAGSETTLPSERRRDSKRDSTTTSRRKSSRRDDYVDENDDPTAAPSRTAGSNYAPAFTAEPSSIDTTQDGVTRYNERDRYADARGSRDDKTSNPRSGRGDIQPDGQETRSGREKGRDRQKPRRSDRSGNGDNNRPLNEHDASLPEHQFPGEMPSTYTQPYRPPGQAATYYGDQGESVSFQPGVRPNQPSIVTNAEQAHLMEPSVDARPPAEPSSLGQAGAASTYFGNSAVSNDSGVGYSNPRPSQRMEYDPDRPSHHGGFGASPRSSPTPGGFANRPPPQPQPPQFSSGGGQFTSSAAAEYYSGSAFQTPPRLPQTSFDGSGPHSAPAGAGAGASFANSNLPLYGAAGLAAGAASLHHHHHTEHDHHHSHGVSGMSNPAHYSSGATQVLYQREHKHRSPLGKFVDWFRDPKAVAEYEQYTEAIGVCKYCFDPMSSPADAPRRHHYRPKRTSSGSRYGSTTRVDKTYRYSSDEERKRRTGVKKVVAGGLAGYGAAKVGKAILKANHDFDDTYSVQSGRPFAANRVSFQGEETRSTTRSKQRYSSTDDLRDSHEKGSKSQSSGTTRRRDKHRSRRRDSSASSSSRGISRGAALSTGLGAAGLAMGAVALNKKSRRESGGRSRSRSRSPPSKKTYYSKRVSPMHSYVDLSTTNSGPTGVAGFFTSPSANKKLGKKPKGFFTFSNASSSSSDADLAYGAGTVRRKRSTRRLSGTHDHSKQYASAAGMMGLVKLGNDLASESDRRRSKGKRVSDGHTKIGRDGQYWKQGSQTQDQMQTAPMGQDEEWYDTDDSDGGLVYGSGTSELQRRESHPQPPRYPQDHYPRDQAGGADDGSRRHSAAYNQYQNGDPRKASSNFEPTAAMSSVGYTGMPPPMQEVEPRPISNTGLSDDRLSRRDSNQYRYSQPYQNSSTSIPLYQPQPVVPVIPFINQPMDTTPGKGMRSTDYRRTKPSLADLGSSQHVGAPSSETRSSRRSRRDSSPAKLSSQDLANNVSFDLTKEQLENERRVSTKDDARGSRREKKDRRKSADAALVMGAGALMTGALVMDQSSGKGVSSEAVRDTASRPSTREAEINRELQALYDEERRQEERKRTLKQLEQSIQSNPTEKAKSAVGTAKRSSSSEDSNSPRRKSSSKKSKARETSPTPDTQQERIARMAAQRVKSTPSPVHEDYGNFFVPQELVENLKEHNEKAEHRDDIGANVVEIVPGASKSNRRNPFDPFLYRPFGLDLDDDPSLHPWPVPMLELVEPTPPGSRAHSVRGDITPVAKPSSVEPPHDVGEPLERSASNGSKVTWGDHDTYVYEVQTPEYERSDYIPGHDESSRRGDTQRKEFEASHNGDSTKPRPNVGRTWTLDDPEAEVLEREVPSVSDRPPVSRAWTVDDKEAKEIETPSPISRVGIVEKTTPHVIEIKPRQDEDYLPHEMNTTLYDTPRSTKHAEDKNGADREAYQSPFAETVSDLGMTNDQQHMSESPDRRTSLGQLELQGRPQAVETDLPDVRPSKSEQRRLERGSSSSERPGAQYMPSTEPHNSAAGPSDADSVFDFLVDDGGKSIASAAAVGLGAAAILASHHPEKNSTQPTSAPSTVSSSEDVRTRSEPKRSNTLDDLRSHQRRTSSKSDPQSDPEDWERSRSSKKDKGPKRAAQSDIGMNGKRSSKSKDETSPDDVVFETPRRSHTESELADNVDAKSSASGRKRKIKRSEKSNGQTREDSASRVGVIDDDRPRRKSKRDSQIFDDGDAHSVTSSPADLEKPSKDKEKDKKASSGFFSNIFSSTKSDVSTSSKRSSKSSKSESRADRGREEGSESRKKRRSRDQDLDDVATAVSEPLRSSRRSSERSRKDNSEKPFSRDESRDDGFVSAEESTEVPTHRDEDEKSFLGKRPEMPQPTDIAMPMDTDGVSGLASGGIPTQPATTIDELSRDIQRSGDVSTPIKAILGRESDLEPISKPSTALRRLSAIRTHESDLSPTPPGHSTPTSVPVHFRLPASSPIAPRFPMSSPIASSASPLTTPRTRQSRPKSTEFVGKNIRPLYLVEVSNSSKIASPDTSDYPPLPASVASSSHPSTEDLRAEAQAQEQSELFTPSRLSADKFRDQARRQSYSYWHDGDERRRSPDYLDSRSATPVPGEAQRARDRDVKPKPKYEFHSPSELLQDPSLLYGDEDLDDARPGSPLPSVVSTDLDYMSARSRSLSPPTRARSLSRGRRSASGSRSTSVSWQDAVSTVAAGTLVGSALGFMAQGALEESSSTVNEGDESAARKDIDTTSASREMVDDIANRGISEGRLEPDDPQAKAISNTQDEHFDQDTEVETAHSDADPGALDYAAVKPSKKTKKDKKKQKRKQLTSTFSDDMLPSYAAPAQMASDALEASISTVPTDRDLPPKSDSEVQGNDNELATIVDQKLMGLGSPSRAAEVDYFQDHQNLEEDRAAPSLSYFEDPSLKEETPSLEQSADSVIRSDPYPKDFEDRDLPQREIEGEHKAHANLSPFEQALEAAVQARGLSQGTTMEAAHDALLPDALNVLPGNEGTPLTTIEEELEPITPAVEASEYTSERKSFRKSKRKEKKAVNWEPASDDLNPTTDAPQPYSVESPSEPASSAQPGFAESESFATEHDSITHPSSNDFEFIDKGGIASTPKESIAPQSVVSTSETVTDEAPSVDPAQIDEWSMPATKKGKKEKKDKKGKKRQSLSWEDSAESALPTDRPPSTAQVPNLDQESIDDKHVPADSHLVESVQTSRKQEGAHDDQVPVDDISGQNRSTEQAQVILQDAEDPWDTSVKKSKKSKKNKRKSLTWADEENLESFAEAPAEEGLTQTTDSVLHDDPSTSIPGLKDAACLDESSTLEPGITSTADDLVAESEHAVAPASQKSGVNFEEPRETYDQSESMPTTSFKDGSEATNEEPAFDDLSSKTTKKSKKKQKKRDSEALAAAAAVGAVGTLALGQILTDNSESDNLATATSEAAVGTVENDLSAVDSVQEQPSTDDGRMSTRDVLDPPNPAESSSTSPQSNSSSIDDENTKPIQTLETTVQHFDSSLAESGKEAPQMHPPVDYTATPLEQQEPEDLFPPVGKKSKKDKKKKRQTAFDEPSPDVVEDIDSNSAADGGSLDKGNFIDASDSFARSVQPQDSEPLLAEPRESADDFGFSDKKKSKKDKKKKRQSVLDEPEPNAFEDPVSSTVPESTPIEKENVPESADPISESIQPQDLESIQEENQEDADDFGFIDKKKAKKDKKKNRQSTIDESDANPIEEPVLRSVVQSEPIDTVNSLETAEPSILQNENQEVLEDYGFGEKKTKKKDKKKKRQSAFEELETPIDSNSSPLESTTIVQTEEDTKFSAVSETNTAVSESQPLQAASDDGFAPIGKPSKKDKKKKRASAVQTAITDQRPTPSGSRDFTSPGPSYVNSTAANLGEETQALWSEQPEHHNQEDLTVDLSSQDTSHDSPMPEDLVLVQPKEDSRTVERFDFETPAVEPFSKAPVDETPLNVPALDDARDVIGALEESEDTSTIVEHSIVEIPTVEPLSEAPVDRVPMGVPVVDDSQDVIPAIDDLEEESPKREAASETPDEQKVDTGDFAIVTTPTGSSETHPPTVDIPANEMFATDDPLSGHQDFQDGAADEWEVTAKPSKKDKKKKKLTAPADIAKDATMFEEDSQTLFKDLSSDSVLPPAANDGGNQDNVGIAAAIALAGHDTSVMDDEWSSSTKKSKKDKKKKRQSILASPPNEPDVPNSDHANKLDNHSAESLIATEVNPTEASHDAAAEGDSNEQSGAAEEAEWGYSTTKSKKDKKKKKRQSLLTTPPNEQDAPPSNTGKPEDFSVEPTITTEPEPLEAIVEPTAEGGSRGQPDAVEEGDWGFTAKKGKKEKKKKRQSLLTTPSNEPDSVLLDDAENTSKDLPTDPVRSMEPTIPDASSVLAVEGDRVPDVEPEVDWGYSTKKSKKDKKKRKSGFEDSFLDKDGPQPDAAVSPIKDPVQDFGEDAQTADSLEPTRELASDPLLEKPDTVPDQLPIEDTGDSMWPTKSKKSKGKNKSQMSTELPGPEVDESSVAARTSTMDTARHHGESASNEDAVATVENNAAAQAGDTFESSIGRKSSATEPFPTALVSDTKLDTHLDEAPVEDKSSDAKGNEELSEWAADQGNTPTDDVYAFSKVSKKDKKKKKRQSTFDDTWNEPGSTAQTAEVLATDEDVTVPPARSIFTETTPGELSAGAETSETQIIEPGEPYSEPLALISDPDHATFEDVSDKQLSRDYAGPSIKSVTLDNTIEESVQEPATAPADIATDSRPAELSLHLPEAGTEAEAESYFTTPAKKSKKDKKKNRMSIFDDTVEEPVQEPATAPEHVDTELAEPIITAEAREEEFEVSSKKSKKDKRKKRVTGFDEVVDEPQQDVETVTEALAVDTLAAEPAAIAEQTITAEPEEEFVLSSKKSKKDKKKKRMSGFDDMIDEPQQDVEIPPEALVTDDQSAKPDAIAEQTITADPEEAGLAVSSKKSKKDKKKKRMSTFDDLAEEPQGLVTPPEALDTDVQFTDPIATAEPPVNAEPEEDDFVNPSKSKKKDKKKKTSTFDETVNELAKGATTPEVVETDVQTTEPSATAEPTLDADPEEEEFVSSSKSSRKDKKKKRTSTFDDTIDELGEQVTTPEVLDTDAQPVESTRTAETEDEFLAPAKKSKKDKKKKRQSILDDIVDEPQQDLDTAPVEVPTTDDQSVELVERVEPTVTAKAEDEEDFGFPSKKTKKDKKKKRQSIYDETIDEPPKDLVTAPPDVLDTEVQLSGPTSTAEVEGEEFADPFKKSKKKKRQSTLDGVVDSSEQDPVTAIAGVLLTDDQSVEPTATAKAEDEEDFGFSSKKSRKDKKKKRQSTFDDTLTAQQETATSDSQDLGRSLKAEEQQPMELEPVDQDVEPKVVHVAEPSQDGSPTVVEEATNTHVDTISEPIASIQDVHRALEPVNQDAELETTPIAEPSQDATSSDFGFEVLPKKSKKDKRKNRQSQSVQNDIEDLQSEEPPQNAVEEAKEAVMQMTPSGANEASPASGEDTALERSEHSEHQEGLVETQVEPIPTSPAEQATLPSEAIQDTTRTLPNDDGTFSGALATAAAAAVLAPEWATSSKKSKKEKKKKRQSTLGDEAFEPSTPEELSAKETSFKDIPGENASSQDSTLKDIPDENVAVQDSAPTGDWGFSGKKSKKNKKKAKIDDLGDDFQTSTTGTPKSTDQFDTAAQTPSDQMASTQAIESRGEVADAGPVHEPPAEEYFPSIDKKTSKKDKKKKKQNMSSLWVEPDNPDLAESQESATMTLEPESSHVRSKDESRGLEEWPRAAQREDDQPAMPADRMDVDTEIGPTAREETSRTQQHGLYPSRSPEPHQIQGLDESEPLKKMESHDEPMRDDMSYIISTENSLTAQIETARDSEHGDFGQTETTTVVTDDPASPRLTKSRSTKKERRVFEFNGTETIDAPPLQTAGKSISRDSAANPIDDNMAKFAGQSIESTKRLEREVHDDPENLSDVSASTRERRRRRRSPPVWAGEEPEDLPRNRSMTPPPEHDDLMDTALGVAAGLGFGAAGHEATRGDRPRSSSPARKQSTGWSFAKLGAGADLGNTESNRDSGVQFESPIMPIDGFSSTRDSGFVADPSERPRGGTDRGLERSLRPPRPQSPTSSTEDVSKKRQSKSRKDDASVLETPRRRSSPVDSTSKERSSVLFNSSPAVPTPLKTNFGPVSPDPVSSPLRRSPSIHGHHHSREELKQKSRVSHDLDPEDTLASNLLDRSAKAEVHREAFSPGPEGAARSFAPNRMSLTTIREDAVAASRPAKDAHPFASPPLPLTPQPRGSRDNLTDTGLATAAVGAMGLAALAMSKTSSRDSDPGHAKSLGRSKSRTSSLRNLRANDASPYDAINAAAGPSHTPVNDTDLEGYGSRNRDMSDVYVSTLLHPSTLRRVSVRY